MTECGCSPRRSAPAGGVAYAKLKSERAASQKSLARKDLPIKGTTRTKPSKAAAAFLADLGLPADQVRSLPPLGPLLT